MGFAFAAHCLGQGTFQNLDFEAATVSQTQLSGLVPAGSALPGWMIYYGTNQQSQVFFNDFTLGATSVDLLGTNGQAGPYGGAIQGGYSVLLQGGVVSLPGGAFMSAEATISQTGLVPLTARSILFKAQPDLGTFLVSLAGQSIPFFALSNGPNYTVYGGDVSAFAGATVELRFSTPQLFGGRNWWGLDDIAFSTLQVPEPGLIGLLALGSSLLALRLVCWGSSAKRKEHSKRPLLSA
jgi:hypothetical protein